MSDLMDFVATTAAVISTGIAWLGIKFVKKGRRDRPTLPGDKPPEARRWPKAVHRIPCFNAGRCLYWEEGCEGREKGIWQCRNTT